MVFLPKVNQKWNPLFTNGPRTELNACVGDNGGSYELCHYAKGFFQAGNAAIISAAEFKAPVDLLVYPIAFSYRHGIELYLKQLITSANRFLHNGETFNKNHKMSGLWNDLSRKHDSIKPKLMDDEAVARANELIGWFHAFDPTGEVFRYPESFRGNRHLKGHKLINVAVLGEQMEELHELLERWHYQLLDAIDYKRATEHA